MYQKEIAPKWLFILDGIGLDWGRGRGRAHGFGLFNLVGLGEPRSHPTNRIPSP